MGHPGDDPHPRYPIPPTDPLPFFFYPPPNPPHPAVATTVSRKGLYPPSSSQPLPNPPGPPSRSPPRRRVTPQSPLGPPGGGGESPGGGGGGGKQGMTQDGAGCLSVSPSPNLISSFPAQAGPHSFSTGPPFHCRRLLFPPGRRRPRRPPSRRSRWCPSTSRSLGCPRSPPRRPFGGYGGRRSHSHPGSPRGRPPGTSPSRFSIPLHAAATTTSRSVHPERAQLPGR